MKIWNSIWKEDAFYFSCTIGHNHYVFTLDSVISALISNHSMWILWHWFSVGMCYILHLSLFSWYLKVGLSDIRHKSKSCEDKGKLSLKNNWQDLHRMRNSMTHQIMWRLARFPLPLNIAQYGKQPWPWSQTQAPRPGLCFSALINISWDVQRTPWRAIEANELTLRQQRWD